MPKKKKQTIKWWNIIGAAALAVAVGAASFLFFSRGEPAPVPLPTLPPGVESIMLDFHFPTADLGGWGHEARQIELTDEGAMIRAVLSGLVEGPAQAEFAASIPSGLSILSIEFAEAAARVDISFPEDFHELPSSERIILIGSMVYTLTGLEFVDNLRFFVDEEPLFEPYVLRNRANTALTVDAPEPIPEIFTLYFPNDQMTGLVAEQRSIPIDVLVGYREEFIVQALIDGPTTPGLSPALPANTNFNSVRRAVVDLVFVDFTADFITNFGGGSLAEQMMIYSLVNTLTEISGVRLVQIFIEGQPIHDDGQSTFHMDLSQPIVRNEALILSAEDN
ncbi:MAG: GerMN domain-containing protein [Clostridiales bacterium]|nr:GerMN domain-containing protein [Clostridiales bacterium]